MQVPSRMAACAFVLAASGCAVAPEVTYRSLAEPASIPERDHWVPFRLRGSVVAIGLSADAKDFGASPGGVAALTQAGIDLREQSIRLVAGRWMTADQKPANLTAFVSPVADTSRTFALEPYSPAYKTTRILPSYMPNGIVLSALEIAVEDHRKEIVETISSIGVGLVKLGIPGILEAEPSDVSLMLPIVIDWRPTEKEQDQREFTGALPNNPRWTWTVSLIDDVPTSHGFARAEAALDNGLRRGSIITSVCRPARITLEGPAKAEFGAMLSDPRYIMSIPLPVTGTITFNALCGANITAAKEVRRASGKELADALFKAVEDIRAAQRTK